MFSFCHVGLKSPVFFVCDSRSLLSANFFIIFFFCTMHKDPRFTIKEGYSLPLIF